MIRVSIVIPVYGKAGLTQQLLEALATQPIAVSAEVIVVDDASTDQTAAMLAGYRGQLAPRLPLRIVSHGHKNTGFAQACNDGAAEANGELIVFLNNDTIPTAGWADALVIHADANPGAAVIGAKLLHVDGTVQHAGVAIGQDRNPHHIYAGFPGDHPAANRVRRMQVVTAACMLVRAGLFLEVGGFDTAFRNGHEDVDLCLRIGALGHEVHYCPEAELVHLESASRGRATEESRANGRLYRSRWAASVQPDDLAIYATDGLLNVAYSDIYPLRMQISPLLALVADRSRHRDLERALAARSEQVADLLRSIVELTVERTEATGRSAAGSGHAEVGAAGSAADDELIDAVAHVNHLLASRGGGSSTRALADGVRRRSRLEQTRQAVTAATPTGATVAVISRGDDDLLDLDGRTGWHLPRTADGRWAGHHPANSDEAIAHVEAAREAGATHLAVPTDSRWWLDQYRAFAAWLRTEHEELIATDACIVFELATVSSPKQTRTPGAPAVGDSTDLHERVDAHAQLLAELRDEVHELRCMATRSQGEVLRRVDELRTISTNAALAAVTLPAALTTATATTNGVADDIGPTLPSAPRMSAGDYARLITRIRALVRTVVPPQTVVAVVSRGDDAIVDLDGRVGWHFPRCDDGRYAGHHPRDSHDAIDQVEALRRRGARYLLFPQTAMWWLSFYDVLRAHLDDRYRTVIRRADACVIYALDSLEDSN